jgi:hypothetical protein
MPGPVIYRRQDADMNVTDWLLDADPAIRWRV